MEYRGHTGSITTYDSYLVIVRSGVAATVNGISTEPRSIPLQAVSGVRLKPATRLANGWIALGVAGRPVPTPTAATAAGDPDVVMFRHRDNQAFVALHDWLRQVVGYNQQHGIDPRVLPVTPATERQPQPPVPAQENSQNMSDQPRQQAGPGFDSARPPVASPGPTVQPARVEDSRPQKLSRKDKAAARGDFTTLALAAARGDHEALERLPAALDATRENWRRGKLESALHETFLAAVQDVSDDDVLTTDEENHLVVLADTLGLDLERVFATSPAAYEQIMVCRINDDRMPKMDEPPVMLKRGEIAYAAFGVSLMKEVVRRETRGSGSSVSIPIGFGVRYRTGTARARTVVVGTDLVADDSGPLTVTSHRILFSGQKKTLEFRHDRLVALQQYTDGLRLGVTNRQTASLFRFGRGQSPTIAAALITHAAAAQA